MSEAASISPQPGAEHEPMKPRLLKGMQADYEPATWEGQNTSGMLPLGKCVLIRMDCCARVTAGGIHIVDDQLERMDAASTTGVLCALGPEAFRRANENSATGAPARAVEPGERVWVEKYAGYIGRGADGKLYRIMEAGCIMAKVDPDLAEGGAESFDH